MDEYTHITLIAAPEVGLVPSLLKEEVVPSVRSHKKKKTKDQDDGKKPEEQEEEVAIGKASGSKSDDSDEDEGVDPTRLVHESVAVDGKAKSSSGRVKYVPPEETPELRDARTVFVGNVPVEVVKNRVRKLFLSVAFHEALNFIIAIAKTA